MLRKFWGLIFFSSQRLRLRFGLKFPKARRFLMRQIISLPEIDEDRRVRFLGQSFTSFSQARQDVFVQAFSQIHHCRTYLEIGAAHPEQSNNTFQLESIGWRGKSIDLDWSIAPFWKVRDSQRLLIADALKMDYASIINSLADEKGIAYLQVDIEPPTNSLFALRSVLSHEVKFATITFEHDAYNGGREVRSASRHFLRSEGYQLVVQDVEWAPGKAFEDWWIHPSFYPSAIKTLKPSKRWFSKTVQKELARIM